MSKTIVVVGAGFAGTYTLKYLDDVFGNDSDIKLVLVNPSNYFLFTPLLHEAATGLQTPTNLTEPLRKIFKCLSDFHMASAKKVNTKNQTIETSIGDIKYDYLVLALGSEINFFNTPGAPENCLTLKSINEAAKIKDTLIGLLEAASHENDSKKQKELLSLSVIGGGPTGVELAAEMSEFMHESIKKLYKNNSLENKIKINLIQSNKELIPQFAFPLRKKALKILEKKGINIIFNKKVVKINKDSLELDSGEKISSQTTVWTAGVKPKTIDFDIEVTKTKPGHLEVDEFLRVKNQKNIFSLGDMASFIDPKSGQPVPATAQTATRQAKICATNVFYSIKNKKPKPYIYKHVGDLVSLGRWRAGGEILGITFSGRLAWWFWRTVYLFKLISWQKKIRVALDWTIDLFSPRDTSQL